MYSSVALAACAAATVMAVGGAGTAAAAGIALINSLGNIGGFVGPYMIGYLKVMTGDYSAGLITLAGLLVLGAVVWLLLRDRPAGQSH